MPPAKPGQIIIEVVVAVKVVVRSKSRDPRVTWRDARNAVQCDGEWQLYGCGYIRRVRAECKPGWAADDSAVGESIAGFVQQVRPDGLDAARHPTIARRGGEGCRYAGNRQPP